MSKEENSGKKWAGCPFISIGVFFALLLFYILYTSNVNKSANIWVGVILYLSSLFISLVVWYYGTTLACSMNISHDFNKVNLKWLKWGMLFIIEIFAVIPIIFVDHLILMLQITFMLIAILAIVFLALTKFFYMEPECWRKRVRSNIEEWLLNLDNPFDKLLLWSALFLILLSLVFVGIIILYYKYNSGYRFLVNLITNKDLFEWTFNLFLFTFFSLIISILGNLFVERKANTEDSEFLFYMLSVKALIIWALVLIVVYSLTRTHINNNINNNSDNNILAVSIYYAIFITVYYYFLKKFFKVINFTMSGQRLKIKSAILLCSRLNEHTLRLWNVFWGNEQFGDALKEGVFLSDFVSEIVYHKRLFQLKEEVSIAADALRGFSDNIDKRYSEALTREVLNIVPRQYTQPKRLPEYLVDVLNAYKDIVCNDKLVCEEPDFEISFYKGFFKSEANEFLPKYQYLDELIYQILVTLRKSIRKLRNDGYFKEHDESRKIICEKFNKFVDTLTGLKCKDDGKGELEETLKTESAKKWIKEAGNLLEEVADNNKDINNDNNNRPTLTFNFAKAVQELKNGNVDTDVLKKVLEKWTEICKQNSTKQDNPKQS